MRHGLNMLRNLWLVWRQRELLDKCHKDKYLGMDNVSDEMMDGFRTLAAFAAFLNTPTKTIKTEIESLPEI